MEKQNNNLDHRFEKVLSDEFNRIPKMKAPDGFMQKVMENVNRCETGKLTIQYKPLITKKHWGLIFIAMVVLIAIAFASQTNLNSGVLAYLSSNMNPGIIPVNWSDIFSIDFVSFFSGIQLSPVFYTGIFTVFLFLLINILIIRKYYLK